MNYFIDFEFYSLDNANNKQSIDNWRVGGSMLPNKLPHEGAIVCLIAYYLMLAINLTKC